jgi:hypothetical protein
MGSTSGSITLQEPAVAGTTTITLPATSGNAVVDAATQTLTNKTLTSPVFGGTPTGVGVLTRGTAVSASGTAVDFTGIPNWARRITIMLSGVSLTGTDNILVQLGDAGGFETTGYSSAAQSFTDAPNQVFGGSSTGFLLTVAIGASSTLNGTIVINNLSGNIWTCSSSINGNVTLLIVQSGIKTLSDVLTQVRIDTTGTNTFDAGSINILYE